MLIETDMNLDVTSDLRAYRLNDDKVLAWLTKKMERLLPTIPFLITDDIKEDQKQGTFPLGYCEPPSLYLMVYLYALFLDVYRQEAVYLLTKYIPESQFKALLRHLGYERENKCHGLLATG